MHTLLGAGRELERARVATVADGTRHTARVRLQLLPPDLHLPGGTMSAAELEAVANER